MKEDRNGNPGYGRDRIRTCAVVVAVLVLVATTGCVGGGNASVGADINPNTESAETNQTGDELIGATLNATDDTETYRIDSETRMDLASLFGVSMVMDTTGEFDESRNLAHASTDGNVTVGLLGFSGGEGFETEVYQGSERRYTKKSNESVAGDWKTTEAGTPLPPGLEDLSGTIEGADATLEGVAEVEGTDAYVLSLDIPASSLGEAFSRTTETHGPSDFGESDEGGEAPEDAVDSSEAYLWVDRKTHRPLRFAYIASLDIEADEDSDLSGSMEFMTDTRYRYGEEAKIEIPEEAEADGTTEDVSTVAR
jgi:hypothetical protein